MINITIKVIGPGQCITGEMNLLEKTLREAGFNVEVEDEYPDAGVMPFRPDRVKIKLVAQHCPWGG